MPGREDEFSEFTAASQESRARARTPANHRRPAKIVLAMNNYAILTPRDIIELMTNILLALLLVSNLVLLFAIFRAYRHFQSIYAQFVDFITPPDDKTPSKLASTVDVMSSMAARAIVAQAKATFMGKQSGQVRGEIAQQADFLRDTNPLAGALMSMPGVGKSLRRNPGLLDIALGVLSGIKGGGSAPAPGNNGHSEITDLKIK